MIEAIREILGLSALKSNWNLEGAEAINADAAFRVGVLLLFVYIRAKVHRLDWRDPVVGPDPEGGIDLTWKVENRRVTLMSLPGRRGTIECVIKTVDAGPLKATLSFSEAVDTALWALGRGISEWLVYRFRAF